MIPIPYKKHEMEIISYKGKEYEFIDMRLDRSTVPEGKYVYEVADDSSDGEPCRIKPFILVDFFGTILADEPIPMEDGVAWIEDEEWYYV